MMHTKLPTVYIEETNFHNAWARLVSAVNRNGIEMPKPEACRWLNSTVVLSGEALNQIRHRETHPSYPLKARAIEMYVAELMDNRYDTGFEYTYRKRLLAHNQLLRMLQALNIEMDGHRRQLVLYTLDYDKDEIISEQSKPCLQRLQLIPMNEGYLLELDWRSRDVFNAWQANLIALLDFVEMEIFDGDNLVSLIVDKCACAHIYNTDMKIANKIKMLPVHKRC